jgi:PAS domain S-box-containing protein
MKKKYTYLLSFLLGSIFLCGMSVFQKLLSGFPISFHGFYIPFLAGGGFGLLIGVRQNRLVSVNVQLKKEIDKRTRTEAALRESEAKYKDLYEHAPDMHFSINLGTTKITACNKTVTRTLGYKKEEIIGRSCLDVYTPDSADHMRTVVLPAFSRTGTIENEELKLRKKDGSIIDVNLRATAVYDEQERICYSRSVWRDITLRKQLDNQIRLMQHWIENSVDLFFWVREDATLLYANKAACDYLGYSHKELCNLKMGDIDIDLPLDAWPKVAKKLKERGSHCFESHLRNRSGQIFPVEITANVLKFEGKTHFFAYARDISDRVDAENKRNALENQLRQAYKMEAIGTLAAGIAHDFNNILSAIVGYTQLLQLSMPEDDTALSHTNEILKAGNRAKELVKQISTFSRQSEQGLKPVSVVTIVKEALKLLRASLPATIEIKPDLKSESLVMGDPTQIHQILMNLCTNAGHAMQAKGGILGVCLQEMLLESDIAYQYPDLKPGSYLKLTVSDTGHGMPRGVMDQIFNPFFTTKEKGEGTGMGLAVVHGIVKNYSGAIRVTSAPGKGSSFDVFIPTIESDSTAGENIEGAICGGTENILVVDDEPALVEIGAHLLEGLGYQVVSRTSSVEALNLFRSQSEKFDLVITDMTMPHMTGEKLAEELAGIRKDIPIILCTGFSHGITDEKAAKIGIKGILMKPIIRSELAEIVRNVLDESKYHRTD